MVNTCVSSLLSDGIAVQSPKGAHIPDGKNNGWSLKGTAAARLTETLKGAPPSVLMLNLKPARQKPGFCGPASLKIVLDYFGTVKSENELARLSGCKPGTGVNAQGLLKAARKLGFKGFVRDHADMGDIRRYVVKAKAPVIVEWFDVDEGHYSVVADIDRDNIHLLDPELGHVRAMRLDAFRRVWFDFPERFLTSKKELILRRMIVILP